MAKKTPIQTTTTIDDLKPRTGRGGPRPNSGRRTRYPGKVPQPVSICLTPDAHALLARAVERNDASQSDVIEALLRKHGRSITLGPKRRAGG